MTSTRYRQWLLCTFGCKHRSLEFFDALGPEYAVNARAIELRVDIIHYLGIVPGCERQMRAEI
jgi:hypothetical protein